MPRHLPRYPCLACGYLTWLNEPPTGGSYFICQVCLWEDGGEDPNRGLFEPEYLRRFLRGVSVGQQRIPLIYSGRVRQALQVAEQAHRGTNRKAGDHPYLLHPVAVAQVLIASGADDDLVCAAYLHDVVEDTRVTLLQVEDDFGQRVATLVSAVTKTRADADGRELSSAGKDEHVLETMRHAEPDAAALKAADLVANVTDLILDQRREGYAHWTAMFGEKTDRKIGHYLALAAVLLDRLATSPERHRVLAEHLRQRAAELRTLHTDWTTARP